MTDAEQIAEARKLLDGTTPGPWAAETLIGDDANGDEWPTDVEIASQSGRHIHGHDLGYNDDVDAEIIANARFIAASRELFPALLDAQEAAQATIAELQADADEAFAIATEAGRVMGEAVDGMKAAEAKLAKAVETLEKIAGAADKEWVTVSGDAPADVQNLCDIARTTLAEIKGESHD